MDKSKSLTFGSVFNTMVSTHGTRPSRPEGKNVELEDNHAPLTFGRAIAEAICDDIPADYNSFAEELAYECGHDITYVLDDQSDLSLHEEKNTDDLSDAPENHVSIDFTAGESVSLFEIEQDEEVNAVLTGIVLTVEKKVLEEERIAASNLEKGHSTINPKATKHPMKDPCRCKMKMCDLKEENRQRIHDEYWKMSNQEQRLWLSSYCKFKSPKRRYSVENPKETQRRSVSRELFLPVDSKEVCYYNLSLFDFSSLE